MSEIIYSIANTFNTDERDGALGHHEAMKFYIAPYQRGYKWSSNNQNSPVPILMTDLTDAFNNRVNEYYLQFITVTENNFNGEKVLELIDGQQRLTTLTLIISILSNQVESEIKNYTLGKLVYNVRPIVSKFFDDYIYNNIDLLLSLTWEKLKLEKPEYNEQDIYYLFNAVNKINDMLPKENLNGFYNYVSNNVKLIINKVENTIQSERIFSNLNSNKVELTDAELIKGLLLTKSVRETQNGFYKMSYTEILEKRTAMGRQWDEIENWVNRPEINSFYFKKSESPIYDLLQLLANKYQYKTPKKRDRYALFNFFQSLLKRNEKTASIVFIDLLRVKNVLNEWFINPEIYNLLGFLFSTKLSTYNINYYSNKFETSKLSLIDELKDDVKKLIPTDLDNLNFGENDAEIHQVLLALSVFCNNDRFDFYSFTENKWSLEHIFPQNPKKFSPNLKESDLNLINSIVKPKLVEISEHLDPKKRNTHNSLIKKIDSKSCTLDENELIYLCDLLQSKSLNCLGNMALLTPPDNSSNSNGMFDNKRVNIVNRISKGSFVPKHTYDVFSKLLSSEMDPNLRIWSERDIKAHQNWIKSTITNLFIKK